MTPILDERAALPPAQGVLLWSMRAWVLGLARSTSMADRIHAAFAGVEAEDAAPSLIELMETLDHGGIRTIEVERMCNPAISADERLLLGVFARVQAGDVASAAAILRGMIAHASVAAALHRVEDVASALLDAGHLLQDDASASRNAATAPRAALC